jgi:site-specific DNA recombinase
LRPYALMRPARATRSSKRSPIPGQSGASLERPGMDRVRDLVAAGGVSVVLAQDRDRFAREPAYLYILREEFGLRGCALRSLNDRGDNSPEGELTAGILDQLAKFERAKTAERTRRGKLHKARSGKVVGGHTTNYGFRMNATRDGYEVDEEKMAVVRRIFRMVGEEGLALTAVARTLNGEGLPGPAGGRWNTKAVRWFVLDDVYRPHTREEVVALVAPNVAAGLAPDARYGVWWFNRTRWARRKVSEPSPSGEGRRYRSKAAHTPRPREEWIAVPVPDSGIPRGTVEAARQAVSENVACSSGGDRFWELSGGVLRCAECGGRMRTMITRKKDGHVYFYYACANRRDGRARLCANGKTLRTERAEPAVWGLVSELLCDPDRLRSGLDAMIERERAGDRGDLDREAKAWADRLAEADRMRSGYQDLTAKGLMTVEELGTKLEELDGGRQTARRELEAVRERRERRERLESDRDALLESYAGALPEDLGRLGPEERRRVYAMLRLRVLAGSDGAMEVSGVLGGEGLEVCRNGGASWPKRGMLSSS